MTLEFLRFFAIAGAGVVLDLAIAWSLASLAGWPVPAAAAAGFVCAAGFNYVLHELWTFRGGERRLSARRAVKYLGVLALTLGVRLAALAALGAVPALAGQTFGLLVLATGVSFVANFLASKLLVFRAAGAAGE